MIKVMRSQRYKTIMKISIIITNYNYSDYLGACINSSLEQKYINKEIIVVDDGSTDESRSIMLGYGSRIKSLFKSNGGQASACNVGFLASSGDVIVFLDSDDMLMPHCLERIAQSWNGSFSKLHYNLLIMRKNGDSSGKIFCKRSLPSGDLKESLLNEGNYLSMPTSGNAFSRSFLNEVMPIPEDTWHSYADIYLMNLAALAGCVGAIDEPLGFWRGHGENMSRHVMDSHVHIDRVYSSIVREINTDRLIFDYCKTHGLKYRSGALTASYPHLQLLMVYDKLAHLFKKSRFRPSWRDYINMTISLSHFKNIALIKIALIHTWMFLILIAPSKLAEKLVVFSYAKGAMLCQKC